MKILKAKIKVDRTDGNTTYVYPQLWSENVTKIPTILYATNRSTDVVESDQTFQILYPVVPDDLAVEFLKLENFSLPTQEEVRAYADTHVPQKDRQTDPDKVAAILAKFALGGTLTDQEKAALDPLNPEPGINRTKHFVDLAKEYGVDNI